MIVWIEWSLTGPLDYQILQHIKFEIGTEINDKQQFKTTTNVLQQAAPPPFIEIRALKVIHCFSNAD